MQNWIYSVISAAGLCAVCGALIPEGRVKKASQLVFAVVMIISVISPIAKIDYKEYSLSAEKYKQQAEKLVTSANEFKENLNRRIIEEKYGAYILDKAESSGVDLKSAAVTCAWSTEGYWYPEAVEIVLEATEDEEKSIPVKNAIEAELGIEESRQTWRTE